jgi:hypothetical protein
LAIWNVDSGALSKSVELGNDEVRQVVICENLVLTGGIGLIKLIVRVERTDQSMARSDSLDPGDY